MITVEEQEDVAAFADYQTMSTAAASVSAAPVPSPAALPSSLPATSSDSSHRAPTPDSSSSASSQLQNITPISPSSTTTASAGRLFSSPLARKLAKESGTSIERIAAGLASSGLAGSGPQGRIVAADVLRAASLPSAVASTDQQLVPVPDQQMIVLPSTVRPVHSPPTLPPVAAPVGIYADFVLSDSAVVLAARQTAAKQSVPHYYLSIELNLSNVMKLRSDLNNKLSSVATGRKDRPSTGLLSVLDFLVKASALAMKQVTYGLDSQTVVKLVLPHDMSLLLLC